MRHKAGDVYVDTTPHSFWERLEAIREEAAECGLLATLTSSDGVTLRIRERLK